MDIHRPRDLTESRLNRLIIAPGKPSFRTFISSPSRASVSGNSLYAMRPSVITDSQNLEHFLQLVIASFRYSIRFADQQRPECFVELLYFYRQLILMSTNLHYFILDSGIMPEQIAADIMAYAGSFKLFNTTFAGFSDLQKPFAPIPINYGLLQGISIFMPLSLPRKSKRLLY